MKKIFIILTVLVLTVNGPADAAVLDFEDLWPGEENSGPIATPYHGFTLHGYCFYITKYYPVFLGIGYENGTVGRVAMFNGYGESIWLSRSGVFNVEKVSLTSAFDPVGNPIILGWKGGYGGTLLYSAYPIINDAGPTEVVLKWKGIDTLSFTSGLNCSQLIIDNIVYNTSPLPPCLLILGIGLLSLAGRRFWS